MGGQKSGDRHRADRGGLSPQLRGEPGAGGGGGMHHRPAPAGYGQAPGMPGAVRERVFVSEVRVCAGTAPELREAAESLLPGVQGALRQHSAVHAQRRGRAGLPQGLGRLCAGLFGERGVEREESFLCLGIGSRQER